MFFNWNKEKRSFGFAHTGEKEEKVRTQLISYTIRRKHLKLTLGRYVATVRTATTPESKSTVEIN